MSIIAVKIRDFGAQAGVALAFSAAAAVLVWVGLRSPVAAFGLLYVGAFLTLAWRAPAAALVLVFALCPFQSDVSSGVFARFGIAEANLALVLPVFVLHLIARRRLPAVGPILIPVLLYLGVCVYSSSVTWRGQAALVSLLQMALYFFVAVAVFASFAPRLERMRVALYALVVVATLLALAAVPTGFAVLGLNKNGIGASLSCALLVAVELWLSETGRAVRRWLLVALAVLAVGLLLSLSRGSWLGAIAGLLAIFGLRRQWRAMAHMLCVLAPLLLVGWLFLPAESREYATGFDPGRYSIQARYDSVAFARAMFERNEAYGQGVGLRKEYDATDIVWVTLAETGLMGAAGFLLIHVTFLGMVFRMGRRLAPESPFFTFLAVGAALIVCQFAHGLVDHYWSRGAIMAAWASAGLATGVWQMVRRGELPAGDARGAGMADSGLTGAGMRKGARA